MTKIIRLFIAAVLLLATPALAQWQVPNNASPAGRGAGVTGFKSFGPCAENKPHVGGAAAGLPQCWGGNALGTSPSAATDIPTKAYVDSVASGLNVLAQTELATAAVLPNTPTYANGASGVGATLTAGANSTLTVDGTVAALNTVVLVKDQASAFQNGIYTVTTAGSGAAAWVLTRATYFDQAAEMTAGSYTFVTGGATNLNRAYTLATTVTTVGTDALTWNLFSSVNNVVTSIGTQPGAITLDGGALASTVLTVPRYDAAQTLSATQAEQVQSNILVRNSLGANRTYYVRSDGNNNCNGLTKAGGSSGACAFLTRQKAYDVLSTFDIKDYTVTIQVGNAGTYADVEITKCWLGTGLVLEQGDTATPSTYIINATTYGLAVSAPCSVSIQGFTILSGSLGLAATGAGANINVTGNTIFSTTTTSHMYATRLGRVRVTGNTFIVGDAANYVNSSHGGNIRHEAQVTQFINNVTFSSNYIVGGFAYSDYGDVVWTGGATVDLNGFTVAGKRWLAINRGMIQAAGEFPPAPTFFPGNVAGSFGGGDVASAPVRPTQLTTNTNNWNPTDASTAQPFYYSGGIYVTSNTAVDITGIAGTTITNGQTLTITNIGGFTITLKSLSGSSSTGNQFALPADVALPSLASTRLQYDTVNLFWRPG